MISVWRFAVKDYLNNMMFTVRYNLFEVLVVLITYFVTDYTFDDSYDAYFIVCAMMLLIWGSFKKLEY